LLRTWAGRAYLALLLCATLPPAQALEHWQQPAYILDSLIEIGLRNEYGRDAGHLRKWQQPIRIWIDHQVPEAALHRRLIEAHVAQLRSLTGHSIRFVDTPDAANLRVVLTRQQRLPGLWRKLAGETMPADALCLGRIWSNATGEIRRALVVIPVDSASQRGRLVSCIVEELTQVLGLPNDSDLVYPSVFNDRSTDQLLSGLDLVLLRLLYDPRLHAGMDRAQVRAAATPVLAELVRRGVVSSAAREVRKGELYRLLGQ